MIMDRVQRAKEILFNPADVWPRIKSEEMTVAGVYWSYACVIAAIPPIAEAVGVSLIGTSFIGIRYRAPLAGSVGAALVSYCLSLAALYLVALVINLLAPRFSSQRNFTSAFKLAAYSWTPSCVAGVLLLFPSLAWLSRLLSLYGFYLLFTGLPVLMETPQQRVGLYVVATIFLSAIIVGFMYSVIAIMFPLSNFN